MDCRSPFSAFEKTDIFPREAHLRRQLFLSHARAQSGLPQQFAKHMGTLAIDSTPVSEL